MAKKMLISPQFEHVAATFDIYQIRVGFVKSVVVMTNNVSLTLYIFPFVLAGMVLIRAWITKMRSEPDVESGPFISGDDHMVDKASGRPISRPYISYTT